MKGGVSQALVTPVGDAAALRSFLLSGYEAETYLTGRLLESDSVAGNTAGGEGEDPLQLARGQTP